jgi:hypothetical protein
MFSIFKNIGRAVSTFFKPVVEVLKPIFQPILDIVQPVITLLTGGQASSPGAGQASESSSAAGLSRAEQERRRRQQEEARRQRELEEKAERFDDDIAQSSKPDGKADITFQDETPTDISIGLPRPLLPAEMILAAARNGVILSLSQVLRYEGNQFTKLVSILGVAGAIRFMIAEANWNEEETAEAVNVYNSGFPSRRRSRELSFDLQSSTTQQAVDETISTLVGDLQIKSGGFYQLGQLSLSDFNNNDLFRLLLPNHLPQTMDIFVPGLPFPGDEGQAWDRYLLTQGIPAQFSDSALASFWCETRKKTNWYPGFAVWIQNHAWIARVRPMIVRLLAMTPHPTQRSKPSRP